MPTKEALQSWSKNNPGAPELLSVVNSMIKSAQTEKRDNIVVATTVFPLGGNHAMLVDYLSEIEDYNVEVEPVTGVDNQINLARIRVNDIA